MLKRFISILLAIILSAAAAGCSNSGEEAAAPENTDPEAGSVQPVEGYMNQPHQALPLSVYRSSEGSSVVGEYSAAYTNANVLFTQAMLNAMDEDFTGVFSPLSLSIALQVLSNGGDDETAEKLLNAVCPGMTRADVNMISAKLIEMLKESEGVTVNSAVVANNACMINEEFAHTAADYYSASVGAIDFSDPSAALAELNGWISENTDGLIKELLTDDDISIETAIVILNALTLKLDWEKPFNALRELTLFHGLNGEEYIGMLNATGEYGYGSYDSGEMVIVPYAGGEYAMAVILPAEGVSPAQAASELFEHCAEAYANISNVALTMPKAELDTKLNIMAMADKLGIDAAANGNYTRLLNDDSVSVTTIKQGASLSVTESGTTAAAATAIVATKGISPMPDHKVVCDRPYAMIIFHTETDTCLFASIVNDVQMQSTDAAHK